MSNNKSDSENDDISGPQPRLCHLRKWSHFQGYGFNLHAEKTRNGQSIGKVDPNSPAESAGLKEKDRIIEVNFVNIANENHQQVVKRIRCGLEVGGQLSENEVVLLVVDPEADEYYKKRNIVVKHDFKNVLKLETPPEEEIHLNNTNKINNNSNSTKLLPPDSSPQVSSHRNSISSTSEHNNSTEINNNNFDKTSNDYRFSNNTNTSQNNEKVSTPSISQDKSSNYEKVSPPQTPLSTKSNGSVSSSNKDTQSNKSSSTNTMNNNHNSSNNNNNNANPFNMSAAEYKAFLKTNKPKSDPRNVHVDIKQKYQIFQNM